MVNLIFIDIKNEDNFNLCVNLIKQIGNNNWARINDKLWVIKTNDGINRVRDLMIPLVNKGDTVFVTNIEGSGWADYGVNDDVRKWLHTL